MTPVVDQAIRADVGRIGPRRAIVALACWSSLLLAPRAGAVELVGYLPYYRMSPSYVSNTLPAQLTMLDEVRYFGLTVDFDGEIVPLGGGSGSLNTHLTRIGTIRDAIAALPVDERPRLNITLGGAGQAASFASVATNPALREEVALNISALLDQTGAESVDLDWEHPSAGAERTTHYPALLEHIKQALGAERRVYATVAPSVVLSSSVFTGDHPVDGVSLMTYDLGWWGNDPNNPHDGEHSLPEYVVDAVNAWTEPPGSSNDRPWVFGSWGVGAPADRLGVGLPFYGRDVFGSAAYTYADLVANGATTDSNYYDHSGQTVWAVDPELAAQRVRFAHEAGLQSVFIWEIGQDLPPHDPDSLLKAAYDELQSLSRPRGDYDRDGDVDADDYHVWRETFGASAGGDLRADGDGDARVNASDYVVWREAMGQYQSALAPAPPAPEPAGAMLLVLTAAAHALERRRRSAPSRNNDGRRPSRARPTRRCRTSSQTHSRFSPPGSGT